MTKSATNYRVTEGIRFRVQPVLTAQRFQYVEQIYSPPRRGFKDKLISHAKIGLKVSAVVVGGILFLGVLAL